MAQLGNLIVNGVTRLLSKLYVSDSVTAPTFIGKLTGNADSATKLSSSAGNATQPVYFSDGKPVATTYTLGKSVPADAKFTDTNTWRGVQNNLTSTATDQSLSAAQGKALKDLVDGKAAASHTHDDRYYTESEIDTKLSGKAASSHTHTKDQVGLGNVDNTADSAKSVKYATSAGSATSSAFLGKNTTFNKTGQAGIQYYDGEIKSATSVSTDGWGSPTEAWYQIIHMPLSVGNYYNDIAIPVNDVNGIAYRQRRSGSYYGWYRIIDSNNWKTYITKSTLGLGSIDNTADADKSVKYATTAGSANAVAWANVSDKPSTFTPASHTHDDRYYTETEMNTKLAAKSDTSHSHGAFGKATADAAGSAGFVPAPAKGQQGLYLRGDGSWATPTNTTYGVASTSANGLMSSGDKSKLDGIATGANNYTHPTTSGNKHIPSGGSSGQILRWSADGTAVWGNDNNTTYSAFKGATSSAAGGAGLVPAPGTANAGQYLRGDGTWATPTNTTYSAASQSAAGLMSADDKKKLDGIATGANAYSHPTGNGNNHIPAGGSAGQILRWSAAGTAVWGSDNNTTYSAFKGATSSAAGGSGLVPAPGTTNAGQYLRGDGTWATPTNTTYSNMTAATATADGKAGLVPAPGAGKQGQYLRGDGTWATPTNTTYGAASQSAAGLMSADDKKKLDGVATGANAYSLPTATGSVLGGVKTGSNITNSSGTISLTKANVTNALGYTPPTSATVVKIVKWG